MHTATVLTQLRSMRLSVMADALQRRLSLGEQHTLAPDDFFAMLVEDEFTARTQRRIQRMLTAADFKPEQACLENVHVSPARGLDKCSLARFTTDAWLTQATNVILTGPTGVGKTYLAEAIGVQACRNGYAVRKLRYKHLFEEINAARGTGSVLKYLRKLQLTPVLTQLIMLVIVYALVIARRHAAKVSQRTSSANKQVIARAAHFSGISELARYLSTTARTHWGYKTSLLLELLTMLHVFPPDTFGFNRKGQMWCCSSSPTMTHLMMYLSKQYRASQSSSMKEVT